MENFSILERWITLKNLMTTYSSGGVYNLAYHDSETLEVDRRFVATNTNQDLLAFVPSTNHIVKLFKSVN